MQKIEVKSYKMKSWEAFSSWNYVLHFFLNFFTDFFYFWYGTPNRYWDYLCEISSSYFGWFGRYLAWGGTLSGLVWRWPWMKLKKMIEWNDIATFLNPPFSNTELEQLLMALISNWLTGWIYDPCARAKMINHLINDIHWPMFKQ